MKIFFSIFGIITVIYFTYASYEQEKKERNLRATTEIVYAQIIELSCGKTDYIKFRYNKKEIGMRIYLSSKECNELNINSLIGLKIDKDKNIVFANDSYNDWSEAESLSIIALGVFFIFCIIYYGIVPEIRKK
ncbi:MAG TPA: hypothetical protein VIV55_04350 [Flavobacterium sp.]